MSQPAPEHVQVTLADATEDVDDTDPVEEARESALEGGARYRQTARDRSESTPTIDTECKGCGSHVGRQYVRVMGLNGEVHACPQCADTTEVLNGAAAGRHRRETL